MNNYNLHPKTCLVPAATLRRGDVVLESTEHPARIVRLLRSRNGSGQVQFFCRYIWQRESEPSWPLGTFQPGARILKAMD